MIFERRFGTILAVIWLVICGLLLVIGSEAIANWRFFDPDDQLRIVQVRDWLAGQSWWDITQYRMNAPAGGPMHWSRLVDVPIAFIILFLGPFLQTEAAEHIASIILPLLTFGVGIWIYARLGRRLFDARAGLLSSALLITLVPVMIQVVPMRIDHHGWQFVAFFGATAAMFWKDRPILGAMLMGLALALWLEISIEALPFAILFMGLLALRWLFPAIRQSDKDAYAFSVALMTLAGSVCILFSITENWALHGNYCDSLSPVHIGTLSAVAIFVAAGQWILVQTGHSDKLFYKIAICAIAGSAGLVSLMAIAPQCGGDAFATLDPLVRKFWYNRVQEGLPVWQLQSSIASHYWGGFAAVMFGVGYLAWAKQPIEKHDRIILILLALGSLAIGMLVSRTALYAIALANMIGASMFIALMQRADQLQNIWPRMTLRVIACMLIAPATITQKIETSFAAQNLAANPELKARKKYYKKLGRICQKSSSIRALQKLPSGSQLMVGLDVAPSVLVFTDLKVVASGHHRNQSAMEDVIMAFIGTEAEARHIYKAREIDYLITCEGSNELHIYYNSAPQGFGAQVRRGELPKWLIQDRSIGPYKVFKVDWSRENDR